MKNQTIINVVSGKGGTGKTLFCSVLAEMLGNEGVKTLVIDLDIFVRGLTALLYFHKKESLNLTSHNQFSVADIFISRTNPAVSIYDKEIGISRYRSFDVLPSVSRINENLNFKNIIPDTRDDAQSTLERLLKYIPEHYQVVLLDSRAGYDELIAATHIISDVSLCIEEDDSISKVTAENLVSQLQHDANTPLFRLVNKARGIDKDTDLEKQHRGILDLGRIPFDGDVMRSYGAVNFWEEISKSLYKLGVSMAWNRLATKLDIPYELKTPRMSPIGSSRIESSIAGLSLKDRVFFVYGIVLTIFGFLAALFGNDIFYFFQKDPLRVASLAIGFVGVFMSLQTVTRLFKK